MTRRVTLIVGADETDDRASIETWFARWEDRLAASSGNIGCGCCVDIYEIDAPLEALAELPAHLFSDTAPPAPAPRSFWQRLTSGFR